MERVSVNSSQISEIGYDKATNVLEIEFKADGSVYQYQNVDEKLYTELMEAESVGSFFSKNIKKNPAKYPFTNMAEGARSAKWTEEQKSKSTVKSAPVKPEEITAKVSPLPAKARTFVIRDNASYESAAEFLKGIKALRAEVDAAFDPIISKAHETHKSALEQKKKAELPLIEAETIMKKSVGGYLAAKEQERINEENRIRKEHQDKIRAQAEEENLKTAQRLADAGDMEGAAAAVDAEVSIPDVPVHVESTVTKVSGISKRTLYVVASVELSKLVKAVANGSAPLECLKANDAFLGAQARAYKKAGELFPGVVVNSEDNIAAGKS